MSITTLNLYESLLQHDRPLAWWGLDTADPTVDDSGHDWTLTAVGAPANAASLLTRGDSGASGSRDFGGAADAYYVSGTVNAPGDPPAYRNGGRAAVFIGGFSTCTVDTPWDVQVGDLLLAAFVHSTNTATVSTPPAGWTQVGTTLNFTAGALAVYKKVAVLADTTASTMSLIWSTTGNLTAFAACYGPCDQSVSGLIFDSGQQATASAATHSTTSENYPNGAMQLAIWAGDFGGTITPDPSGLIAEDFSNNESAAPGLTFARYEQTTAGSGSRYCTTSVASNLGAILITAGNPDVVDHNELDSIASNISIHALIRPDTIVGGDTIIRKHQAWGVHLATGQLKFLYRDGGGVDRTVNGPTLSAGNTYHVVMWDDGTNINWQVDGVLTQTARVGSAGYTTNTNRVQIGSYWDNSTQADFFDGRIDEVAVWDRAITRNMALTYWTAASTGTFYGAKRALNDPKFPAAKVEIAWASNPTDECLVYENVTGYLRSASCHRGRNFERDRIETGTAHFAFSDRERAFDDANTSSPFYPNVKPTRPIRIRGQVATDGVVFPIWFGYTEAYPLRRSAGGLDEVAEMSASDTFKALALDVLSEGARPQELSSTRLAALLGDVPGVPYSGTTGHVTVAAVADFAGTNRLDHAQSVAVDSENGILFSDAKGTVTSQDGHYRTVNERTVRATYDNAGALPFLHMEPSGDEARLFTAGRVTGSSGDAQTSENTTASAAHFVRTKDVSTLQAFDNNALATANLYANRYSTHRTRIPAITLSPRSIGATMWTIVLGHEISHRIKTVDRPFGAVVNREHFVEGITHEITPDDWQVTLNVSPWELDGEYMLIGTAEIGDAGGQPTSAVIGP